MISTLAARAGRLGADAAGWLRSLSAKTAYRRKETSDLLVACSTSVLRLSATHRGAAVHTVTEGNGLYYGLARDLAGHAWVGARNALVSEVEDGARESAELLRLGPAGVERRLRPSRPFRDLHGIACDGSRFWVTSTLDDAIVIFAGGEQTPIWWEPLPRSPCGGNDQYHFNTVWLEGDRVWLTAHRRGPSWLLAFDLSAALRGETTPPLAQLSLGVQAHNIWRQDDGELCTCSSIEGVLVGERGWRLETGGFPRGIARTPQGWVVGVSALKERRERDFSDAELLFFDSAWRLQRRLTLPRVGMVLDLMPIPSSLALATAGTVPVHEG